MISYPEKIFRIPCEGHSEISKNFTKLMPQYLKYISLSVLVVQTTACVLILRYSRTVPQAGPRYLASTTIVISEIFKLLTCIVILFINCGFSVVCLASLLYSEIWGKLSETCKVIIPAGLYTVQNHLLFLALTNLDAATYQVTYQIKILMTAIFSVIMLHKKLEISQWLALVLLMLGVTLVQMPGTTMDSVDHTISSQVFGLMAVLVASVSSGFSGVYFEKLVKCSTQSLWIRNIQLAMFSLAIAWVGVITQDYHAVMEHGFFQGYFYTTWTVILLQAFGGLVVSTVVKYADNILKGFATSVSIVLSTVCSYYLLGDFSPSRTYFLGASIVIVATLLYGCQVNIQLPCYKENSPKCKSKNSS